MVVAWLAKADQALADAAALAANRSPTGTMNRCYYAMFYGVKALAVRDGRALNKHRALISYLHREYVKSGRLSMELGRALLAAFDDRAEADYHLMVRFSLEDVARHLDEARQFVAAVKAILR